jgi:ferrous-iron efflux pump FieF
MPLQLGSKVLLFSVFISFTLIVLKLVAYFYTDSVMMLSSLMDSSIDMFVSVCNFFASKYALKPSDEDHKFGHNAIEDIATFSQAGLIIFSGLFLIVQACERYIHQTPLLDDKMGIWVMCVSLGLTSVLVITQKIAIKYSKSMVLLADNLHYETDIIVNIGLLACLFAVSKTGFLWIDSLVSVIIGIYIIISAAKLGKSAFNNLMAKELEELRPSIISIVKAQALELTHLRTRQAGNTIFIEFCLVFSGDKNIQECTQLSNKIKAEIAAKIENCDISIHFQAPYIFTQNY